MLCNRQGKGVPVNATWAHSGAGVHFHYIFTSALHAGNWPALHSSRLTHVEKAHGVTL